ncbi:hypothetical protein HMPREF9318_01688 [Streptococcus urinalis FB127-CNA-2]|uniref:Uncharacterized protein n=1 Tax=Streptococcus urinalis 2285-97 TaxID=764291 RepID=G5KET5_9STRE|nr:hypothetical protein [Streptococcus urinalis]EHJ56961.1 hypothetical protein STRUR_2144 [Streptococcus urinalis 2285-97]EKS18189.1 hypothetical protein HMPREF9318_01688 [Streptococcus urinalis FB127-CNA-2]VEF32986.1 Uncharacterised protein [Streptococcus urinalis]
MVTDTKELHFELERSIARRVDSKLIPFQVSISDGFYSKYTKLWKAIFSTDFVTEHRSFYAYVTKDCVYDNLEQIDRKSIAKRIAELEALADVSETKEDFCQFFEKKYNRKLPDYSIYIYKEQKELSDFDNKLLVALKFNDKRA